MQASDGTDGGATRVSRGTNQHRHMLLSPKITLDDFLPIKDKADILNKLFPRNKQGDFSDRHGC